MDFLIGRVIEKYNPFYLLTATCLLDVYKKNNDFSGKLNLKFFYNCSGQWRKAKERFKEKANI